MSELKIYPYIMVLNAKKAINEYIEIFNARLVKHIPFTKKIGEQFGFPADFNYENSTMHAELEIKGAKLFLADNIKGSPKIKGNFVEIFLEFNKIDALEEIYNKIKDAGWKIRQKLERMFWGDYFCRVKDPFGISWQMSFSEE